MDLCPIQTESIRCTKPEIHTSVGLELKIFSILNFSQSLKRNKNAFLRLVCKGSNTVNQFAYEAYYFRGLSEIH